MKKDKIVKVKWEDTVTNDNWATKENAVKWSKKDFICESVGFLMEKNKKHIILASMRGFNEDVSMSQKIPMGCVKSIKRLK